MSAAHTPRPWACTIEIRDRGGWREPEQHIQIYAGETLVADYSTAYVEYPDDPENEANARLIAAAPDLLEALKRLREKYSRCARLHGNDEETVNLSVDFVDVAIAKTEGQR